MKWLPDRTIHIPWSQLGILGLGIAGLSLAVAWQFWRSRLLSPPLAHGCPSSSNSNIFNQPHPNSQPNPQPSPRPNPAQLSPAQLNGLSDRYGQSPQELHEWLGPPLCQLPRLSIRANAITEREVYWSPQGDRIILAYEEQGFVGYSRDREAVPSEWLVQRSWSISVGDRIGGYGVVAALGEVSLQGNGPIYAPRSGLLTTQIAWVRPKAVTPLEPDCSVYVSPELPSYALKLCGFSPRRLGYVSQGEILGTSQRQIQVALLTQRYSGVNAKSDTEARASSPTTPEPIWQYVEPSPQLLQQLLQPPAP